MGRRRLRGVLSWRSLPGSRERPAVATMVANQASNAARTPGCMQRIGGVLLSFLGNLQRHTHSQGLRAMRGNQNVPGLGPTTILVVLHRHAGWGEISGHRTELKQVAHSSRGSIADSSTSCAICVRTARSKCSHCITISIQGSIPRAEHNLSPLWGHSRRFDPARTTSGFHPTPDIGAPPCSRCGRTADGSALAQSTARAASPPASP